MAENTKSKGNNAELEVLAFFKRHGFSAAIPFGDNDPYDLIVESPTRILYRIQVRWASWQGDSLGVSLQSCTSKGTRTLDLTRIEAFAAWDGADIYIVPVSSLQGCRAVFTIRRNKAKNNQVKGIHLVDEFRSRLDLLP